MHRGVAYKKLNQQVSTKLVWVPDSQQEETLRITDSFFTPHGYLGALKPLASFADS